MDLRRLRAGEWIVALSGVALLVSLFLPWEAEDRSGWESTAVADVVLALIAAAALAVFVVTANQRVPAVPIALEAVVTLLGFVAFVIVAVHVIWPGAGREWGLWLALAAAAGLTAGAWRGIREERMAGAPPPPEIEALPAPRP